MAISPIRESREPAEGGIRKITVWDIPTRVFHWALVVFVCVNLFIVSPEGGATTVIHFVSGFAIAGLLLFRLAWGFVGSHYSRFSEFIYRPSTTIAYGRRLLRLDPPRSLGHNPLGGWMVVVLLVVLTGMIATGLFAANRHAAGPLSHLLSAATAGQVGGIHSLLSNILIALIIAHLAGVAFDWLVTRENLLKAMLNGRKVIAPGDAVPERAIAPMWRAVAVGIVAVAVAVVLVINTDYAATRP